MHDRQSFYDFLGYQANVALTPRDFELSAPRQVDGVHAEVTLVAKDPAYLDRIRRIGYRRHDLTGRVFTVPLGQAKTVSELVDRLAGRPVMKYRALVGEKVECRFIHLRGNDVQDDVLPQLAPGELLDVKVSETSDYFIGNFKLEIA